MFLSAKTCQEQVLHTQNLIQYSVPYNDTILTHSVCVEVDRVQSCIGLDKPNINYNVSIVTLILIIMIYNLNLVFSYYQILATKYTHSRTFRGEYIYVSTDIVMFNTDRSHQFRFSDHVSVPGIHI